MKNSESNRIAEVVSQGRSMTWDESLQCQMVRVRVSQCPTGGWRNHQGTLVPTLVKKPLEEIERGDRSLEIFAIILKPRRKLGKNYKICSKSAIKIIYVINCPHT